MISQEQNILIDCGGGAVLHGNSQEYDAFFIILTVH